MSNVDCEIRGSIAILTLNRPEKLNALTYAMNDLLMQHLDRLEADRGVRLIILTGAGDRAFSAGGDIPEFRASIAEGTDVAVRAFVRRGQAMTARIEGFPKPVIAAVNGIAFGGGCEITEAAHLAVASDRAVFAKPEIAIGIPPTFGGTQRLARLAGRKRALDLLLTGATFGPDRALDLGLVNRVVPHGELMSATFDLADQILAHPSDTAEAILTAVTRGLNMGIAEGLQMEAAQFARVAASRGTAMALDGWLARKRPSGGAAMPGARPMV